MSASLREKPFTREEYRLACHGSPNKNIITYLFGREPSVSELERIVQEKESQYRRMCLDNEETFQLAPGVPSFLDSLKAEGIPMTIATGSYPPNVDFYFQHLNLSKWFDRALVVLDDGSYPGKPAPDIFVLASEKLQLTPSDCLVFEDTYMGIHAAHQAGAAGIIAVDPDLERSNLATLARDIIFCNGFSSMTLEFLQKRLKR